MPQKVLTDQLDRQRDPTILNRFLSRIACTLLAKAYKITRKWPTSRLGEKLARAVQVFLGVNARAGCLIRHMDGDSVAMPEGAQLLQ